MTAPLTPEREQYWREMARTGAASPSAWPQSADRYFVEGGLNGLADLLAEIDRLRDELAEVRAGQDPTLRCLIVKPDRDRDLYVGWSQNCDGPTGVWSRQTALEWGFPRTRLDRADANGSSATNGYTSGHWDDAGFVAEQRGWLKRERLGDYAQLYLAGNEDAAFDLLEPFEGETEVRR